MDVQGACKNQIATMKDVLGDASTSVLDRHLEEVTYMRKSFV